MDKVFDVENKYYIVSKSDDQPMAVQMARTMAQKVTGHNKNFKQASKKRFLQKNDV